MVTAASASVTPPPVPTEVEIVRKVGRYELYGPLGHGGMATVHLGRLCGAEGFVKLVAIKRLHSEYARDQSFVSSFKHEARLAARIRHPNVVSTLDVVSEGGELFVVMEYLEGESLANLIRTRASARDDEPTRSAKVGDDSIIEPPSSKRSLIPMGVACAIVQDLLHGLHAAHEAKDETGRPLELVHRDVSPQNVIVGIDGSARVLDFGIAKAADEAQNTEKGTIKGKVSYMAPEQIFSEDVDRRLDVYAAGVVLWELLAGRRLFKACGSLKHSLETALTTPIEPPGMFCPDVPPALDEIVLRALSRDREGRFDTAMAMAIALGEAVRVASRIEVARWVQERAAERLDARNVLMSRIEALPRPAERSGKHSITPPKRSRRLFVGGGIAAAMTIAVAAAASIQLEAKPLVVGVSSEPVRTPAALPPAPPFPPPLVIPVGSSELSVSSAGLPPGDVPDPRSGTFPRSQTAAKRPPPVEAPSRASDCTPPYTLDEKGHKKYKLHCLK